MASEEEKYYKRQNERDAEIDAHNAEVRRDHERWEKENAEREERNERDANSEYGSSDRVICTHFYRKGMLAREVWRADMTFTAKHLSETTVRGYHFWAIPYVQLMRKNSFAERIMFPLAKWRAEELGYQMGVLPRSNFKGKAVRLILEPFCWTLGCFVDQKDWRVLEEANKT
ncbi:MAG: hypothetical protein AAB552_00500 [Patescibacteria group bacterium]|mgnify:FL=1